MTVGNLKSFFENIFFQMFLKENKLKLIPKQNGETTYIINLILKIQTNHQKDFLWYLWESQTMEGREAKNGGKDPADYFQGAWTSPFQLPIPQLCRVLSYWIWNDRVWTSFRGADVVEGCWSPFTGEHQCPVPRTHSIHTQIPTNRIVFPTNQGDAPPSSGALSQWQMEAGTHDPKFLKILVRELL